MKIPKLLVGGSPSYLVIANPFFSQAEDAAAAASSKSSGKKDGLLSESLLNELYKKGIPVDVDNFVAQLAKFEQLEQWGLGVSPAAIRGLEAQANRIIQQANYLNRAENFAEKNASLGEIAVGSKGQLYVQKEDGSVKTVQMSQYDPEKDGYALTVGDLIEQRKFNPEKAYDIDMTQTINNNLGMQKINEYIQGIIKTVGESSTTNEAYTDLASYIGKEYAKKPTEAQLKNLQQLAEALLSLGPDAIFKNKEIMKSRNILEAFEYIRNVLPRDMKIQLSGRWVANGGSLDLSGQYMDSIIAQALLSANDTEYGNYLDFDAGVNKAAGNLAGRELNRNLKAIEVLTQGSLGKIDYNLTSKKYPDLSMQLHGSSVGALTNYDNNIIPKSPLSIALENSIGPLIDKLHISIGDQKINESLFDTILYDGNDVINIWAPVDSNGDIDLNGLKLFNDILLVFENDPSLTTADKNRILSSQGIQGYINEDGSFTGSGNMSLFLVFTGITSDEIINEDNIFADKVKDKKAELEQIDRIYLSLNTKSSKYKGIEFKKGWFDFSTDLYRAPIFMKLKPTAQIQVGTFANHGPLISTPRYSDLVTMDQLRYNQEHLTAPIYLPSSSILLEQ